MKVQITHSTNSYGTKTDALHIDQIKFVKAHSQETLTLSGIIEGVENSTIIAKEATLRDDTFGLSIIQSSIDLIQTDLKRVLGLMHENIYIDNTTYDEFNNLVTARVRIYSNSNDVGSSNNVIGEYQIYSDNLSEGKFNNWRQIKVWFL